MAEEQNVRITEWPAKPAPLKHEFGEEPCPVRIHFEAEPARVHLETSPKQPLHMAMATELSAKAPLPICIRVCEPICAESDYRVGLTIFDQMVATVAVRGRTRIGQCDEGKSTVCVNFTSLTADTSVAKGIELRGVQFQPLAGELRVTNIGAPAGQLKLGFAPEGVAIVFPSPSQGIVLRLNCYAGAGLKLVVRDAAGASTTHEVAMQNEAKAVSINEHDVVRIEVIGGRNEASLIEVCFEPAG
jgi:hypothetical protein